MILLPSCLLSVRLPILESLKSVAGQFLACAGFTRALLHFGTRNCNALCTASLILAAHVLREPLRKDILDVVKQSPYNVDQAGAFQCLNFLLQGLGQMCHDDWKVQQMASKVKRSSTEFTFIMRKRDGSHDATCPTYKNADDNGKKAKALAAKEAKEKAKEAKMERRNSASSTAEAEQNNNKEETVPASSTAEPAPALPEPSPRARSSSKPSPRARSSSKPSSSIYKCSIASSGLIESSYVDDLAVAMG